MIIWDFAVNKRVLITGATGFLGKHLIEEILKNDLYDVVIINKSGKKIVNEYKREIEYLKYDGTYDSISCLGKIDCVIHLATDFKASHKTCDISNLILSNIQFGTHLLEYMKNAEIKNIINVSTYATSIDGIKYSPQNLYAATKKSFEDILTYYSQAHNINVFNLECYDMYGLNDNRGKFIDLLLNAAKSGIEFKMSKGEQEIGYIYVDDIVNALLIAIQQLQDKKHISFENFSLCGSEVLTLAALVKKVEDTLGIIIKISKDFYPYKDREIMKVAPRFNKLPIWTPKVKLSHGILIKWRELNAN